MLARLSLSTPLLRAAFCKTSNIAGQTFHPLNRAANEEVQTRLSWLGEDGAFKIRFFRFDL